MKRSNVLSSRFHYMYDFIKQNQKSQELKNIDRMERQSLREEALLDRIASKEKKLEGGTKADVNFEFL